MADFKKAQYAERIAKKDNLKPITINWEGKTQQITTYAQLKELMDAAVEDALKIIVCSHLAGTTNCPRKQRWNG